MPWTLSSTTVFPAPSRDRVDLFQQHPLQQKELSRDEIQSIIDVSTVCLLKSRAVSMIRGVDAPCGTTFCFTSAHGSTPSQTAQMFQSCNSCDIPSLKRSGASSGPSFWGYARATRWATTPSSAASSTAFPPHPSP